MNEKLLESVTTEAIAKRIMDSDAPFDRIFRWKNTPERKRLYRRRCRVLAYGSGTRSALIEFENGERVVTSVRAIKLAR